MACVMLIALAAALIATVASVGGALLCRSRARSAADATALSAASAYWSGGASDPCAVGRRAAAENDAQLESCAVEGDDIVVTVSVPLRLSFRNVRPKLFGKRYLTCDIEMAVDYVFGRDTGAFRAEAYFRLARGALGKANGIWEYRLRRPPGARGTVGDVRFTGKWPARTVTDGGDLRWIYHDAETPDFTAPTDWIHRIGWTFRVL